MGTRTITIRGITTGTFAGSFTLPVDFDASGTVDITCIGAGGGGARRATFGGGGGGGGGGGLARGSFSGLKPGSVLYFSAGRAGAGSTAGSTAVNGTAGGDTWVNVSGTNAAPTTSSQGVLAKGGNGGSGTTGGTGGSSTSGLGNIANVSGGNGGNGGTLDGSGGGGGGSSGRWIFPSTYNTGTNGGNGYSVSGDGGGGGGGGVNGAGSSSFSITGGSGGLSYTSTNAAGGTAGQSGGVGNPGGGGGGSGGISSSGATPTGGVTLGSINQVTGAVSGGWSCGGGGGGGGTNNSGLNGADGGSVSSVANCYGGGGGGGGSGRNASGGGGTGGIGGIILTYTTKETMLPSTNLSFTNIQTYFGGADPISLNEYYGGGTYVHPYAKNSSGTTVPASGQIGLSNFQGAPWKLYRNIRVGYYTAGDKYSFEEHFGYRSSAFSPAIGTIDNTAFTLSGGTSVTIAGIIHSVQPAVNNRVYFYLSSSSAISDSGWDYMFVAPGYVYTRTSRVEFSNNGAGLYWWAWDVTTGTPTGNPFEEFAGSFGWNRVIYFV